MQASKPFTPSGRQLRAEYSIPYYSQFASPELVSEIVNHRLSARDDPRWREFGAETAEQYEYWSWKACGIASFKMAVEALGVERRPMMAWIRAGIAAGGFIHENGFDRSRPSGWVHRSLADLARAHGLAAGCAAPVGLDYLFRCIESRLLAVASVSYELGTLGDITRDRGHLILIHGCALADGEVEALLVNNPSGREPQLRRDCWIPAERFAAAFSGRIIAFGPPDAGLHLPH
jgi:hypothetical protein